MSRFTGIVPRRSIGSMLPHSDPCRDAHCRPLAGALEAARVGMAVARNSPDRDRYASDHVVCADVDALQAWPPPHGGGHFFRNHINFHHVCYSKDHLVSPVYLGNEGNNTPFFLIPMVLIGACAFFLLPLPLFIVGVAVCAASFYAHVFFDKEYHVEASRFERFAWFRRKRELHFVHHRHANCNFAVIDFFWDRLLGTYRKPGADVQRLDKSLATIRDR